MTDNPFDIDYVDPAHDDFLEDFGWEDSAKKADDSPIYHPQIIQGSDEWLQLRCGILTASEMKKILTPTLKTANNGETRVHAYELAFQRISQHVEPQYVSDAMLRGQEDEIYARAEYSEHYAPVTEMGFVTSHNLGFMIGYSPDGLVGDDGLIEAKSRAGKYQVQTIATDEVPEEYMLQLQTGLLVTGRKWIDFISYSGGLPMFVKRVEPIAEIQEAIVRAACEFEVKIQDVIREYNATLARMPKIINTERRVYQEIVI